jgi:hypothetical protein
VTLIDARAALGGGKTKTKAKTSPKAKAASGAIDTGAKAGTARKPAGKRAVKSRSTAAPAIPSTAHAKSSRKAKAAK